MKTNIKLKDIIQNRNLEKLKDYLFFDSNDSQYLKENWDLSIEDIQKKNPTWNQFEMADTLDYLIELSAKGRIKLFSVTSDLTLIKLEACNKTTNEYFILCSGGAYGCCCNLVESFPAAKKINEEGMDCYILNYHTATKSSFILGLFPQPLDDLANAIYYIQKKLNNYSNYYLGGYSAGGHLVSLFSTDEFVNKKYKLPYPKGLILGYPLLSMDMVPDSLMKRYMCKGMFGENYSHESIILYSTYDQINENFPKTYIVRSYDDIVVDPIQVKKITEKLNSFNIPYIDNVSATSGHGFGVGDHTPLKGYIKKAITFLKG